MIVPSGQIFPGKIQTPRLRRHRFARNIINYIVPRGPTYIDLANPAGQLNEWPNPCDIQGNGHWHLPNPPGTNAGKAPSMGPMASSSWGGFSAWTGAGATEGAVFDMTPTLTPQNLKNLGAGAGFSWLSAFVRFGATSTGGGWIFGSPLNAYETPPNTLINWSFQTVDSGPTVNCGLNVDNTNLATSLGSVAISNNVFTSVACSMVNVSAGNATAKYYVNGILQQTTTNLSSTNPNNASGEDQINIGNVFHIHTGINFLNTNGIVFYGATMARGLDPDEPMAWHQNPWMLIDDSGASGSFQPGLLF
jgi:hypothetical protein